MKRNIVFTIVVLSLLTMSLLPVSSQDQEPIYFSDTITFDYNLLMGSDGGDFTKVSAKDSMGNIIISTNVDYVTTGNANPFYTGPYYDTDPNYKEFNITANAYDTTYNGGSDIVITKISPEGEIIFSTYFGGNSVDISHDIAINSKDEIIIVGETGSSDFPRYYANKSHSAEIRNSYISKFSPDGDLIFSTYWGGEYLDPIREVFIDSDDNIIISGISKSKDFPLVNNALPRISTGILHPVAFLAKLSPNLDIIFSTQIGGSEIDTDYAVTINNEDQIIMMGMTKSEDFPIVGNAFDETHNGIADAFYTKFSKFGQILLSSFLGGNYLDWIDAINVDDEDNVVITGYSQSDNFPTENGEDNELNNGYGRNSDAIIVKMNNQGQMIFSTYFGGSSGDRAYQIEIDSEGYYVVAGTTQSEDFPTYGVKENLAINNGVKYPDGDPPKDVFVSKFANDGRLAWSVVYGSSGVDTVKSAFLYDDASMIITGETYYMDDFPNTNKDFISGYFFDTYISKVNIPPTPLPPGVQFQPYRINDEPTTETTLFESLDKTSWMIIISVGGFFGINIISKTGIVKKLRSRNDQYKEEINNYLENLRNL